MTTLKIEKFVGLMPSVSPRNLGAAGAQVAHNMMSGTTEFVPVKSDEDVCGVSLKDDHPPVGGSLTARTLFRLDRDADGKLVTSDGAGWIATTDYRSYAKTQIKDNTSARTCYSFDDVYADGADIAPRIFDAKGEDKKLGVPAPEKSPTLAVLSNEVFDTEAREKVVSSVVTEIAKLVRENFKKEYVGYPLSDWGTKNGYIEYTDSGSAKPYVAFVVPVKYTDGKAEVDGTYVSASKDSLAWILDSAAGSWPATSRTHGDAEYPAPAWQLENKAHLCVSFRCSATQYAVDATLLSTALETVSVTTDDGESKVFTEDQIGTLVAKLNALALASDADAIKTQALALTSMIGGGAVSSNSQQIAAFYARADVVAEIASSVSASASKLVSLISTRPTAGADTTAQPSLAQITSALNSSILVIDYGAYPGSKVLSLSGSAIDTMYKTQISGPYGAATASERIAVDAYLLKFNNELAALADKIKAEHFSGYASFPADSTLGAVKASDVAVKIANLNALCNSADAVDPTGINDTDIEDLISSFLGEVDINSKLPEIVATTSEDRAYGVTWVTKWGEESAMSFPSNVLKVKSGDVCQVTRPALPDDKDDYDIAGWRLYRSSAGTSGAAFQLVPDLALLSTSSDADWLTFEQVVRATYAEMHREESGIPKEDIAYWLNHQATYGSSRTELRQAMLDAGAGVTDPKYAASVAVCRALAWDGSEVFEGGGFNYFKLDEGFAMYEDAVPAAALSGTLQTYTHLPPPANLKGLVNMPNGVTAGFFDNTVCFSEPYMPHAWPVEYQIPLDYPVVKLAVFGQSLFVGTMGSVCLISGASPANMSQVVLPGNQACISARSVVPMDNGVVFASPDGLCLATLDGVSVVTKDLFLRPVWQSLQPKTIRGAVHDGLYLFSYQTSATASVSAIDIGFVRGVYAEFGRTNQSAEDEAWWVSEAGKRGYDRLELRWAMLRVVAGYLGDKTFHAYAVRAVELLSETPVYGYYALDLATGQLNSISSEVGVFFYDAPSDNLMYVAKRTAGHYVVKLRTGDLAEGAYRTGITRIPSQKPFSWAHVEADGPVTLRWIGDNKIRHQITFDSTAAESVTTNTLDGQTYLEVVANSSPARLPPGRYIDHVVELFSSSRITGVTLAGSTKELQEV